jgi:hypothetical protein
MKFIKSFAVVAVLGLCAFEAHAAFSVSQVVLPGNNMTNILSPSINSPIRVLQITATSVTSANVSAMLVDTPTNSLTFTTPAYTNTISYATNYISSYTNFYGVGVSLTNLNLIDVTNNLVPASTNFYSNRISISAMANSSTIIGGSGPNGLNYFFNYGIWATNTGTVPITITVTYIQ